MTDSDNNQFEALMLALATQASADSIEINGLEFPDRWSIMEYLTISTPNAPTPPPQGFLAKGNIDPTDPTSQEIAVLALGISWSDFFQYYQYQAGIPQMMVPTNIAGTTGPDAKMDGFIINAYTQFRPLIWASIKKFLGELDLYICGLGLGAPIAQLTALDLRPDNQGPDNQFPPKTQSPCYCFSAPNVATAAFAEYYNKTVITKKGGPTACTTLWAGSAVLKVDHFPSEPTDTDHAIIGTSVPLTAAQIPKYDVPWLERGGHYYGSVLGLQSIEGPNIKSSIVNPPAGYDQYVAYTMASLVADAYHYSFHPTSGQGTNNYVLENKISVADYDAPFAFIYTYNTNVVVVFRGAINWQETQTISANTTPAQSIIISGAVVNSGISDLYNNAKTTSGNTFKAALRAALVSVLTPIKDQSPKLYFTGHDIGGALANLAAADFAINTDPVIQLTQAYTFGAMAVGGMVFQSEFNKVVGSKCYQVIRVYDQVSKSLITGDNSTFAIAGTPYVLNGQLPQEDISYHDMSGYIQLLNPNS